jgi:glycosyltransferase involved in cell wall biosynthesis
MAAGFTGAYDPAIVVRAPVDPNRMTRAFHRRWHYRHGRSFALMRSHDFEPSQRRLCGVPGHVVRSLATAALDAAISFARRRYDEAFGHELRARFAAGFIAQRLRQHHLDARRTEAAGASDARLKARAPSFWLEREPFPTEREASAERQGCASHRRADGPRVSVVIPCYNQGRFLRRAIQSVLMQTRHDVEAIVVDDGSSDETAAVAQNIDRVRYFRQPNRGVAAARNAGLARARGDFVIFLDADDELTPEAAAIGVDALAEHPAAACVAGVAVPIDEMGREQRCTTPAVGPDDRRRYDELLTTNFIWTPGCAMFRRAILLRAGGFDESLSRSADYALYLRLSRDWEVHWHGRPVVRYRRHMEAMSANAAAMLRETLVVLRRERRAGSIDRRQWLRVARVWRDWYGDQIVDRTRASVRAGRWMAALADLAALVCLHPAGTIAHARRAIEQRNARVSAERGTLA